MKKFLILLLTSLIVSLAISQQNISLNGTWKISIQPPSGFWKNNIDPTYWSNIKVPGECMLQGFKIESDKEFVYKRSVVVPEQAVNKKILIRFDGVYSYARVWINGKFVRDHFGGFTTWYCDITSFVKPGKEAWLTVAVTDKKDDLSQQSFYAHHLIGGILRNVSLIILPKDHINNFHVETDFDDLKELGILKISGSFNFNKSKKINLVFRLKDKNGIEIKINKNSTDLTKDRAVFNHTIHVNNPAAWSAEDPYLYTLYLDVWNEDELIQSLTKKIGFRKIQIFGNELFINKMPVKLRGACRHDVHPLYGRSTTNELDETDVKMMKNANINFVRTSHYPPTEYFLELCDQHGIYVEEENAICFLHNHPDQGSLNTNNEPYVTRAVEQLEEMIERDRDHASVIMWSIGNESKYGTMFKKEYEYIKAKDKTRPVIFSYPHTVKQANGSKCYDILSLHYPSYKGQLKEDKWQPETKSFKSDTIPALSDEYAHLACYNTFTLDHDPGVREFWGESIDKFWNAMFDSTGCLGGAIWAWSDEMYYMADTAVGYGPWGAVDGWRRPKPEYWHLKKAYSPIKILNYTFNEKHQLRLTIFNRFDHTTLAKIWVAWESKGKEHKFPLPHTLPQQISEYLLPVSIPGKDNVTLRFYLDSQLIDETNITLKKSEHDIPFFASSQMVIEKNEKSTIIKNKNFYIEFDHSKGLMNYAICGSDTVLKAGPYLNFGYKNFEKIWESQKINSIAPIINQQTWTLQKFECKKTGNYATVEIQGNYDSIQVSYLINISDQGKISTKYNVNFIPANASVIGLRYQVPMSVNAISWKRKGYWGIYPEDHIGRVTGTAKKNYELKETYKESPTWPWKNDRHDYFLNGVSQNDSIFGPCSRDFKSCKFNIFEYSLHSPSSDYHVSVLSEAKESAKMDVMKDGSLFLCVHNIWRYPDLGWGNYVGPELPSTYEGFVTIILRPH